VQSNLREHVKKQAEGKSKTKLAACNCFPASHPLRADSNESLFVVGKILSTRFSFTSPKHVTLVSNLVA
jgi:hypothetical protein